MIRSFARRQSLTAKALTISATGMGVGFGSCGLGVVTSPNRLSTFVIYSGSILFFISLVSLVTIALIALGKQIAELVRK